MQTGSNDAIRRATRVYTRLGLALYDGVVMGLFAPLMWRCSPQRFVDIYRENVSGNHADIGVGTGYCLDRCDLPTPHARLVLIDIEENCLEHAAKRLSRYTPETYVRNACEPIVIDGAPFDSVALGGVLHCLPGSMREKCAVLDSIRPVLHADSVVFGYTLVRDDNRRFACSHLAFAALNGLGIINNRGDRAKQLRDELSRRFKDVLLETHGSIAFFRATWLAA